MKEIFGFAIAFGLGWWCKKTLDDTKAMKAENEKLKARLEEKEGK